MGSVLVSASSEPLFVVFTDAIGAYDHVWSEALFAKLATQHPDLADVKVAAELYTTMESYIIQGDKSEVINAILGIPQGGTRSAKFF